MDQDEHKAKVAKKLIQMKSMTLEQIAYELVVADEEIDRLGDRVRSVESLAKEIKASNETLSRALEARGA